MQNKVKTGYECENDITTYVLHDISVLGVHIVIVTHACNTLSRCAILAVQYSPVYIKAS